MRVNISKSSSSSYFLSMSLVALLTTFAFHVLEMDPNAYACSCSLPESTKDALENSDAVFSGKVIDISGKHPNNLAISRHDPVSVTFSVDRVWKGPANSTMIISTESSEASCGYEFQQDETYVVYSYEKEKGNPSTLRTGLCSGTDLFSDSYEDLHELGTGAKILQPEDETGKLQEKNKVEPFVLTSFELYFEEEEFTKQGPNHNILRLDKGESATLSVYIKNNDDIPYQITMKDSRGVGSSGTFESFSFEPEQFTVLPHQTNSTKLHLTISNDTDTHSKFVTFLAQSDSFGMRGIGFFIVVDREIDDYVDKSLRRGLPGGAFPHLNTEISETDAEKLIGSGFGIPKYLPQGYKFQGMDGSEGQQRLVYSSENIDAETTVFSGFWNDGGLLVIYNVDGPNVNNTKSLPFKIAQDEGQQIMINGMMGDATEKQTRAVVESNVTYDVPASVSFFDDAKKKSAHLRANMSLDELLRIASSIPIYDRPDIVIEENKVHQQGQADYPPARLSDIAPLKQFHSGIPIEEIQCKESLVLVTKHDSSPACVKEQSIPKLVERGWVEDKPGSVQSSSNIKGLIYDSQTRPENNYHLFTNELEDIDTGSSGITLFGLDNVDGLHGKFVEVSGSIEKDGGEEAIRVNTFQITGSLIPKGTGQVNANETLSVDGLLADPANYYNQNISIMGELREHDADVMIDLGVGCSNAKFSTRGEFIPEFSSSQQLYNDGGEEQVGVRIGSVNNVGISAEKLPPDLKNKQVEISGTFVPTIKKQGWSCMPTIYHSGYILTDLEKISLVK